MKVVRKNSGQHTSRPATADALLDEVRVALARGAFATLTPELAVRLFSQGMYAEFEAGTELYQPGDPPRLALLLEGAVRVYHETEDGRQLTICRMAPGELVGLVALARASTPFRVQSVDRVRLWAIDSEEFRRRVASDAALAAVVIDALGEMLGKVAMAWAGFAFAGVEERVLAYLRERGGATNFVRISRQALADEIGATREATTRSVQRLRAAGALEAGPGGLRLRAPGPG